METPANPAISIVIPTYNHADVLGECLRSVIAQGYAAWEALVVDDASMDSPAAVIAACADPRVRLLTHACNRGLAAARNTGFSAASTTYIVPLDADDQLHPDYLSRVMDVVAAHPEVDCVFTDLQLFGAENDVWHYQVRTAAAMAKHQWIPGAGALLRKSLWQRVGGYCEDDRLRAGNEDWDFWIGAVEQPLHAFHIPEPLYRYRRTAGSMSGMLRAREYETREIIYQRHRDFFAQAGVGAGAEFLADGYRLSALASEDRTEAQRLWRKAWQLHPHKIALLAAACYARAPRILQQFWRGITRRTFRR